MILTPYQVYLLKKEYKENNQTIETEQRNMQIRTILDASMVKMEYCSNQIGVGTTFCVSFLEDEELSDEEVYTLVENKVANESIKDGIISLNSPFGIAVHRKKVGETFAYETENGILVSGIISQIYTKEEHQNFIQKLKVKTIGGK